MKRLLALLALGFLFFTSCVENKVALTSRSNPKPEDVVYMSDIDGLVTAVMIYGMTNGIVYNGTNYIFVVEDMGPATPVTKRETTFDFYGEKETHLIEGTLDQAKLIELGFYDGTSWLKPLYSIEIGSGVTMIGENVFNETMLEMVTIPNSVTNIGNFAFCVTSLTSINIPSSVISIGDFAFESCNFTSISIPPSVKSIGMCSFARNSQVTSISISNGLMSIGDSAFDSCGSLTTVTIPSSVTIIGNEAFSNCSGLTSVTMSGKDKATVQGMTNYSWELPSGCIINCTDGVITIP